MKSKTSLILIFALPLALSAACGTDNETTMAAVAGPPSADGRALPVRLHRTAEALALRAVEAQSIWLGPVRAEPGKRALAEQQEPWQP